MPIIKSVKYKDHNQNSQVFLKGLSFSSWQLAYLQSSMDKLSEAIKLAKVVKQSILNITLWNT